MSKPRFPSSYRPPDDVTLALDVTVGDKPCVTVVLEDDNSVTIHTNLTGGAVESLLQLGLEFNRSTREVEGN